MNPSSNTAAALAATMAATTNAAGPSRRKASKADCIGESKTCVAAALRAFLICPGAGELLERAKLKTQPTAVRLRRELSDLVHLGEVFRAGCKEHVAAQSALSRPRHGKCEPRRAGWPPLCRRAGEMTTRFREAQRPTPLPRQVENVHLVQSQDSRRCVPIPVRAAGKLRAAHNSALAHPPSVVVIEERLAFGDHAPVVAGCTAKRERSPLRLARRHAAQKFFRVHSAAPEITARGVRRPVRRPSGSQTHPAVMIRRREIEKVVALAETQFVPRLPAQG